MCDPFDNGVPPQWRADMWAVIAKTPHLDYLLLSKRPQNLPKMLPADWPRHGGYPNVWLGTTAEDQPRYGERYSHLQKVPAHLHFISYEPALGPLTELPLNGYTPDWIIAGGESGPHHRKPDPRWFEDVRDECERCDVPFLFKQWGGRTPKAGGRLLGGVGHNGFPLAMKPRFAE